MNTIASLCLILTWFAAEKSVHGHVSEESGEPFQLKSKQVVQKNKSNVHRSNVDEFPYHVAFVMNDQITKEKHLICQGALIYYDWIITSATCIWINQINIRKNESTIIMGTQDYTSADAIVRHLVYYTFHPQFNRETGQGNDVVMINEPVPLHLSSVSFVYLIDPSEEIKSKCKYSSYNGHILYGNNAKVTLYDKDCEYIGVPNDVSFCVVMDDTLHKKNRNSDLGSPITCGDNKLYAIRNCNGYFTIVYDISSWMLKVVDERSRFMYKPNALEKYIKNSRFRNDA